MKSLLLLSIQKVSLSQENSYSENVKKIIYTTFKKKINQRAEKNAFYKHQQ